MAWAWRPVPSQGDRKEVARTPMFASAGYCGEDTSALAQKGVVSSWLVTK
ncbi:MAG: hypothetical protein HYU86_00190 [Chloroflexi bacterium]|nr:hypothetical protein [Chloroflexota bacterium]